MLPACSCVCDRSDKRRKDTKKSEFDKEKTNRRAISTVNGCLVADKLSFLSLEVRSCDIVHVTADEAKGLFTCNRPCTDRKCRVRSGHGKSGKSMDFVFENSRPGNSMEVDETFWKEVESFGKFLFPKGCFFFFEPARDRDVDALPRPWRSDARST